MSRTNIEALKNLYAKIANTTADAINPHTIREAIDAISAAYGDGDSGDDLKSWSLPVKQTATGTGFTLTCRCTGVGVNATIYGNVKITTIAADKREFVLHLDSKFNLADLYENTSAIINGSANIGRKRWVACEHQNNGLVFTVPDTDPAFAVGDIIGFTIPTVLKKCPV